MFKPLINAYLRIKMTHFFSNKNEKVPAGLPTGTFRKLH